MSDIMPQHFDRKAASSYLLSAHGLRRAPGTLAKLATIGGGPRYRKAGARSVTYSRADLDAWAAAVLTAPIASTSELRQPAA